MQLSSGYFRPPGLKAKEFEYPAFSPLEFVRVMQVSWLVTSAMEELIVYDFVHVLGLCVRSWTFAAWT